MNAPQLDLKNPSVVTVESLNSNASSAYEDFPSEVEQSEYTLRSDRDERSNEITAANCQPRMATLRAPGAVLSELEQVARERDELIEKLAKKDQELTTSQAHQAKMWKVLNKQRKMINELRADLRVATSRLDAQVKQTTEEQVEMTTVTPTSLHASMALRSEEIDDCLRELSSVVTPVLSANKNAPAIPPKNRPAPIETTGNGENLETCVLGPTVPEKPMPKAHKLDHSVSMSNISVASAPDFKNSAPVASEVSTVSSPGSQRIDQALSQSSAHHTPSSSISSTRSQPRVPYRIGMDTAVDNKRVFRLSCSNNRNHTHRHDTEVVVKLGSNDLPRVKIVVNSTLVSGNKRSLDNAICILSCTDPDTGTDLWSISKDYNSLVQLDKELRPHCGQYYLPKLPEKQLFNSSAPPKMDQRRDMLNDYFGELIGIPLLPKPTVEALCFFLSTNAVDGQLDSDGNFPGVRGYLTKRGKLFGQWKASYFELDGPFLNYFDRPGGSLSGSISLYRSNVGPMSEPANGESDFRHAFVIVESKKKDQSKHILCAESDRDRDMWVNACVSLIEEPAFCEMPVQKTSTNSTSTSSIRRQLRERSSSSIMSLANGTNKPDKISTDGMSSVTVLDSTSESAPTSPSASRPLSQLASGLMKRTGSLAEDLVSRSSDKQRSSPSANGQRKKLSLMRRTPFADEEGTRRHENRDDGGIEKALSELGLIDSASSDEGHKEVAAKKQLFGSPICEACELSAIEFQGRLVPAIIVRCIELLEHRDAFYEEGIFRISGSQSAVRTLRSKFNTEYDVDLIEFGAESHAVTTLLKQFLRELQDQIIPSNMAVDFKAALDLDAVERVARLKVLVTQLPECNLDLLCVLCGLFDRVLRNSALNKMSLRNLGIVVSPAVNISAPVFIALLSDYSAIFH